MDYSEPLSTSTSTASGFTMADLDRSIRWAKDAAQKREAIDRKVFLYDGTPEDLKAALNEKVSPPGIPDDCVGLWLCSRLEIVWSESARMTLIGSPEAIRRLRAAEIHRFEMCLLKPGKADGMASNLS